MGAVKINGTTSGSVSLEAPASGSDVTLTLPGTTMNLGTELASKLPIAGGKILQIVRATDSTNRSTTSTSFVDVTGMSVTITPQKSDSAIIVFASGNMNNAWSTAGGQVSKLQLADSSNNALSGAEDVFVGPINVSGTGTRSIYLAFTLWAYVTPATTSAVTYKMRFARNTADLDSVTIENSRVTGQIFAIEVSA